MLEDWRTLSRSNGHARDGNAVESDNSGRFPVGQYGSERGLALSQDNGDIATSGDDITFDGDGEEKAIGSSSPVEDSGSESEVGPCYSGGESARGRSASGSSLSTFDGLVITPSASEDDETWHHVGEYTLLL